MQTAVDDDKESAVDAPQRHPRELYELARGDLETLLEEAPQRSEAVYLLALVNALLSKHDEALAGFEQTEKELKAENLPFAHNRSVCLMHLAEERLSQGQIDEANAVFDRVAGLGVLAEQIPTSWVKVRIGNVRHSLQANNFDQAQQELDAVRSIEGLSQEQKSNVELLCSAFDSLVPVRQGNDEEAIRRITAFLDKFVPAEFWEVDEDIADEHLDSACDRHALPISPEVYRALLFTLTVSRVRQLSRQRRLLTADEARELSKPLLCAFQFHLRHRELLASLGGIYYWFIRDSRQQATEWLRSAVDMGATSRVARRLLDQDRKLEMVRRETLDWFRDKSARFLRDPTLKKQTRQALVEELSRFQEFQPLLLDLENSQTADSQQPTLKLLRERARYLEELAGELTRRKRPADVVKLEEMRRQYAELIEQIDAAATQMSDLENDLVAEVGKTVLS